MTATAMMMAVTILLGSTPLGLIRLPFLTATTLHIPVIIAVLVLGLKAGLLTGLTFGLCSLITNLQGTSFFAPFFINPLVSVLPRLLFPAAVYGICRMCAPLAKRAGKWRYAMYVGAAALGTALHTAMVMGMIYLLYAPSIRAMLSAGAGVPQLIAQRGVGLGVAALGVANGIPEMIVASLIAPPIAAALERVTGRRYKD